MDIQLITIHQDKTIIEALEKLNDLRNLSRLILFVVDNNNVVVGSITDGDVRRSLIQHADVEKKVGEVCNRNFTFEYVQDSFLNLDAYRKKDIKVLPLLDKGKKLKKIIDLKKINAVLPVECMIMAGGRGKRLSPLTDEIPKPLLPLGNKPIIEHNIDRLISFGIKKIYISLKYLGEQIRDYFGDGSTKGVQIEYIWEDKPLGTAGALSLVENFKSENILLMNGDLFTNINFEDLYKSLIASNADMAVASTEYKIDIPYAVFETEGERVKNFKEKPSYRYHSNAGIYILKKELIDKIPKNRFYDITDLMKDLVDNKGKLVHEPIIGYWIDIGKPEDYKQAQEFIKHS
ncbi:CBS domain-containing protein [Salegentibacter echinorum]|uniref:CBS domain-containing protein n=1 Tax=Salegentibacter echinorum TaxID=1073325 RepID=A0A1M5FHR5_SALEC|nr:nucleotidyltransferase family protein [Salegentibacter echinorum]SHF91024.1 CBS domain-containing protein [Salegentibacter echinorum]